MTDATRHVEGLDIATAVGHANAERIEFRGHDLVDDLMGVVGYSELLLLAVTGRSPRPEHVRVADAVLVCLADHGMQPSALSARLTYFSAPDAVQGALAAGILGAGSSLLGSMEQAGHLLDRIAVVIEAGAPEDEAVRLCVASVLSDGGKVPGFGHRLHRAGDPRAARLLHVARENNVALDQARRLELVGQSVGDRTGRTLHVNATGAAAALLLGIGVPWQLHRGFSVASRIVGLLAHIGEEMTNPVTPAVRDALRSASWLVEDD